MDDQTYYLIVLLLMNAIIIIERFLKRIKKSSCCELSEDNQADAPIALPPSPKLSKDVKNKD